MYQTDNTKLAAAQALVKHGLQVFPCHTVEDGDCSCGNPKCTSIAKHPLTQNGFKAATNSPDKLSEFFTGEYAVANIGVATGEASGVIVLDADEAKALKRLQDNNESLPKTPIVESSEGRQHLYFAFDERCHALENSVKFAGGLDVRTTGGYVLAPPSVHKSGHIYRWIVSPDDYKFARLPNWLFALMPKHDDVQPTFTVERSISEYERAKRYLAKTPPAISGQGGDNRTFAVICRLCELFPTLDDEEMLEILADWNALCEPPWTLTRLEYKIGEARKKTGGDDETEASGNGVTKSRAEAAKVTITFSDWPSLHPNALYGLSGDIVRAIEPHTEADPVALLLTFLNGFGNLVGNRPYFVADGSKHHAKLFTCIVGQSSRARKGTSLNHIRNVFAGIDNGWRERWMHG